MSVRRCLVRGLSWSRHAHIQAGCRRPRTGASSLFPCDTTLAVSLLPSRPAQCRLNHDETSNLGTQVTIDILNKPYSKDNEDDGEEAAENIYVTSFSTTGVRLSNKFTVVGPCILFPRAILSWNVASAMDITTESLTLFSLLEPRLDVLIIGIGDGSVRPPDVPAIITYCRRLGISVEILNTEEACATFNFLNGEQRHVAAAIVPPKSVSLFNPEYFLHDKFTDDENILDHFDPKDASNPKNWYLNPDGVMVDNSLDFDMSRQRGKWITKRDAKEIRHSENLIREEIEAMEDRFTPHGEKVVTELEKAAKVAIEEDLQEYDKTGVISDRLQLHLNTKDKPTQHVDDFLPGLRGLEQFREEKWHGLDKSRRFQKKFDKLYDVGQEEPSFDFEEEGRKLAEEAKMTLMGEKEGGEERVRLLEGGESEDGTMKHLQAGTTENRHEGNGDYDEKREEETIERKVKER